MARSNKTPEAEIPETETPEAKTPKRNKDGFIAGEVIKPKDYVKFVAEQRAKTTK